MENTLDSIDSREACRLATVKSYKTLIEMAKRGEFPPAFRVGKKMLRWDRRAVEEVLAARRQQAIAS